MDSDFNHASLPPLQLWLARHGSNVKDEALAGAVPLSEEGREEISRMADFLFGQPVSYPLVIITAGLTRNLETADIIEGRLVEKGVVHSVKADALVQRDYETLRKIILFVHLLDTPKDAGLDIEKPRSLLVIGNRQNFLVELLSIVFDPLTEVLKLIKDPELIEGMNDLQMTELIFGDDLNAVIDDDKDIELFPKARLVGLEFAASEWRRVTSGKRICDRTFASNQEKSYLKDWQP